jgi:hypothetical protein
MAKAGFRHADWDSHYEAASLVDVHEQPDRFLAELIRDATIPLDRRRDLAAKIATIISDAASRDRFFKENIAALELDREVSITLRLFAARLGERHVFEGLIEEIDTLPVEHAATTIALFGHFPDRSLAERAAELMRERAMLPNEIVRVVSSVNTGMRYVFEMDFGFGGGLRSAPPHPGIRIWRDVLEEWTGRAGLTPRARLFVLTAASQIGSDKAAAELEHEVLSITDFDAQEWSVDDELGHVMSSAIRRVQKRRPILPQPFIERVLASSRYNIATQGIDALQALGDEAALRRLIELHSARDDDWHLRDTIANAIELMAARQQVTVWKDGRHYRLSP